MHMRQTERDMTIVQKLPQPPTDDLPFTGYLDILSLIERLHRLLLDVIKDCLLYTSPSPRDS